MSEQYANAFATKLSSAMTDATTTAHVVSAAPSALQGGQFRIVIGTELMLVTAGASTTTWTVERHIEGTSAAAHSAGHKVTHVLTVTGLLNASVFDVRAYGPVGTANDTPTIEAAMVAAAASVASDGRAILMLQSRTYVIKRRTLGVQTGGGIYLRRGVSIEGNGATLRLQDNCAFIAAKSPLTATVATITGNVAVGNVALTVGSSTGFTTGDEVFVRLGDNAWDSVETCEAFRAVVVTVGAGTITLDRPAPIAMTVASTAAGNKTITLLDAPIEGVSVSDLILFNDTANGGNAEAGLDLGYTRDVHVSNITASDPGAGVIIGGYVENLVVDNIAIPQSSIPGSETAKGRAFNLWNARGAQIRGVRCENVESNVAFIESYSRGVRMSGVRFVNNNPDRASHAAVFFVAQGSQLDVDGVQIEGNGDYALTDSGGTTDNRIRVSGLEVSPSALPSFVATREIDGPMRLLGVDFEAPRSIAFHFHIAASVGYAEITLPAGLTRRLRAYVSSTTGITQLSMASTIGAVHSGGNLVGTLVAGQAVEASVGWGTVYPGNSATTLGRKIVLETDGTVPSGTEGVLFIDYWPVAGDDGSGSIMAKLMGTAN